MSSVRAQGDVVIVAAGAVTSIGLSAAMTTASVRCGVSRILEVDSLRSRRDGRPCRAGMLPILPAQASAEQRMLILARQAAVEATAPLADWGREAIPTVLALPPSRPGLVGERGARVGAAILRDLPVNVDRARSGLFRSGHEAGIAALVYASDLIRKGHSSACLLGGVDCPLDLEYFDFLQQLQRLQWEDQPRGLIPGEGAGFVLLMDEHRARRQGLIPMARVLDAARAAEPRPFYLGRPTHGDGLTEALWRVLRGPEGPRRADTTFIDLNGELWRADEWAYAYLRTGKHHGEPLSLCHPADCFGDLGAAVVPVLLSLATHALYRGYDGHQTALVLASSDTQPYRGACLLARATPQS